MLKIFSISTLFIVFVKVRVFNRFSYPILVQEQAVLKIYEKNIEARLKLSQA